MDILDILALCPPFTFEPAFVPTPVEPAGSTSGNAFAFPLDHSFRKPVKKGSKKKKRRQREEAEMFALGIMP